MQVTMVYSGCSTKLESSARSVVHTKKQCAFCSTIRLLHLGVVSVTGETFHEMAFLCDQMMNAAVF